MQSDRTRIWIYANGNLGKSALSSAVDVFALFYLTTTLQLSGPAAGTILLVSMIWDAITDPMIGFAADRHQARFLTATPYFAIGIPVAVVMFVAFFSAQLFPVNAGVLICLTALIGFRTAYALIDVPHNALLASIARTPRQRTDVASLRIFFSAIGKLCVTALASLLFSSAGQAGRSINFVWLASAMAAVAIISLTICASAVRNIRLHLEGSAMAKVGIGDLIRNFRASRSLRTMFLLTATNSICTPGIGVAIIYVARYELGDAGLGARAVFIQAAAQAASLIAWNLAVRKVGSRTTMLICGYGLLALVAAAGAFGISSILRMYLVAAGSGFALGGIFMLNWALLPDALDHARQRTPTAALLSFFGLYTIVNKAFTGLAQGFLGYLLGALAFDSATGFTGSTNRIFQAMVFCLPIAGSVFCLALLVSARRDLEGQLD